MDYPTVSGTCRRTLLAIGLPACGDGDSVGVVTQPPCEDLLLPRRFDLDADDTAHHDLLFDGQHIWVSTVGTEPSSAQIQTLNCSMNPVRDPLILRGSTRGAPHLVHANDTVYALESTTQGTARLLVADPETLEFAATDAVEIGPGVASAVMRADRSVIALLPTSSGGFELRRILADQSFAQPFFEHPDGGDALTLSGCSISRVGDDVRVTWADDDRTDDPSVATVRVAPDGTVPQHGQGSRGCFRGTTLAEVRLGLNRGAFVSEHLTGPSWTPPVLTAPRTDFAFEWDSGLLFFAVTRRSDLGDTVYVLTDDLTEVRAELQLGPRTKVLAIEPISETFVAAIVRSWDEETESYRVDARIIDLQE